MSLAISMGFWQSFLKLPDVIKKRTIEVMERLENNPQAPGLNYETIQAAVDKKLKSIRINDTYRAIVKREDVTGTTMLLWVDHHNEAYDWASKKKCDINALTGHIQLYSVEESIQETNERDTKEGKQYLFSSCTDDQLLRMGVPQELLLNVKKIENREMFNLNRQLLPDEAAQNLEFLLEGATVDEVLELVGDVSQEHESVANKVFGGEDFVIVDGESELRSILNGSLEKWRIFLHPSQREVVQKDYSGPARVLGEAGTGKTIVAMHRAKRLAGNMKHGEKVLFTTFTKNLAEDIKMNLKKICSDAEYAHIEVMSIDAWIAGILNEFSYPRTLVYGDELDKYWQKALDSAESVGLPKDFYKEEWSSVVAPNAAFSKEAYVGASRIGRGTRLDRLTKFKVWDVFEKYISEVATANVIDIEAAIQECIELLNTHTLGIKYPSIIVDEGQDLSTGVYSLLRKIAGEEHKNDIFIVGDAHQRIYRKRAVLSKCGINIRGRSSHLKINYRTTEEIRKYAYAILSGLSFDDLDGNIDDATESRSFVHGQPPVAENFKNVSEESDFIIGEINNLANKGIVFKDICIVARTKKLLDSYSKALSSAGIRCYEVKDLKQDDREVDGVRIATMHRVKGLEFQCMFVVAANKGTIPLERAIDHTDKVSEEETTKAEKCLLYVALTRAQKYAYVTSFGERSEIIP